MAKLLFKPFALVTSLIASRLAGKLFNAIWSKVDSTDDGIAPSPTRKDVSLARAATGNMVQAATFAGTQAVADRARVRAIYHWTGLWTGDKPPKHEDAETDVPAAV